MYCRVCGAKIRVMAFEGTGACCQRHLEELASRPTARSPHESSLEQQLAQDLRVNNGSPPTWMGAWSEHYGRID